MHMKNWSQSSIGISKNVVWWGNIDHLQNSFNEMYINSVNETHTRIKQTTSIDQPKSFLVYEVFGSKFLEKESFANGVLWVIVYNTSRVSLLGN